MLNKTEVFTKEISWIKNPDISKFIISAIQQLPDYFFTVAASSTGKYHPKYALGNGGLVRHTKAAVGIAHDLLSLEMFDEFSDDEKDILPSEMIDAISGDNIDNILELLSEIVAEWDAAVKKNA